MIWGSILSLYIKDSLEADGKVRGQRVEVGHGIYNLCKKNWVFMYFER